MNIKTGIAVAVAIAVVGLFFVYGNPLSWFSSGGASVVTSGSDNGQLVVQDEVVGTGEEARPGTLVTVNYTGRLQNGTVFDTTVGKEPQQFPLGLGYVIPGWEQGLQGMKVGGTRVLIIPPSLGYGSQDYGPIPGGSTLVFEVELLNVEPIPSSQ